MTHTKDKEMINTNKSVSVFFGANKNTGTANIYERDSCEGRGGEPTGAKSRARNRPALTLKTNRQVSPSLRGSFLGLFESVKS